jgi:hypothetical protein
MQQEESYNASPHRKLPKSIKVRILTWNMHDSLPKVRIDLAGPTLKLNSKYRVI